MKSTSRNAGKVAIGSGMDNKRSYFALPSKGGMSNISYFIWLYRLYKLGMSNMLYFTLPYQGSMLNMTYLGCPIRFSFGSGLIVPSLTVCRGHGWNRGWVTMR